MHGRIRARAGRTIGALIVTTFALAVSATAAGAVETEVVYNNTPSPRPGNVVSQAFEATQTSQFGGVVELGGTARRNGSLIVGMSSWACQKGSWTGTPACVTEAGAKAEVPVVLNINEAGPFGEVGPLLKSIAKTVKMPYRPSENRFKCVNGHGEPTGAWYFKGSCFHGKYFKFSVGVGKFTWPSRAIISISYNTSDYGSEPQRPKPCNSEPQGCFYDSLNVGLMEPPQAPTVGGDPQPNDVYQNTQYGPYWCDGGTGGTGTFRLDAGCWQGNQPIFEIRAVN